VTRNNPPVEYECWLRLTLEFDTHDKAPYQWARLVRKTTIPFVPHPKMHIVFDDEADGPQKGCADVISQVSYLTGARALEVVLETVTAMPPDDVGTVESLMYGFPGWELEASGKTPNYPAEVVDAARRPRPRPRPKPVAKKAAAKSGKKARTKRK